MKPGSLCVLNAQPEQWMAHDIPFRYRQQADFWYYTGFEEPDAVMILEKPHTKDGEAQPIFHLFVREKDPAHELWDGARAGVEGARCFGCDHVYSFQEFPAVLARLAAEAKCVYYEPAKGGSLKQVEASMSSLQTEPALAKDEQGQSKEGYAFQKFSSQFRRNILEPQRVVKSPAELALMKTAADHASRAYEDVMRTCKPGLLEVKSDLPPPFTTYIPQLCICLSVCLSVCLVVCFSPCFSQCLASVFPCIKL